MATKVIERVMSGTKTAEGKLIACLLAVSLSLMAWNVHLFDAFADTSDESGDGTQAELVDDSDAPGDQDQDQDQNQGEDGPDLSDDNNQSPFGPIADANDPLSDDPSTNGDDPNQTTNGENGEGNTSGTTDDGGGNAGTGENDGSGNGNDSENPSANNDNSGEGTGTTEPEEGDEGDEGEGDEDDETTDPVEDPDADLHDLAVEITIAGTGKIYDGTPLTADDIKPLDGELIAVTGLPEGFTLEATVSGSITDAGTAYADIDPDYVIRDADGQDKTKAFRNVTVNPGELVVSPAKITVTTGSATKAYDGAPLTNDEASVAGLIAGESVVVAATGSRADVGSIPNTFRIDWTNAKERNYTVEEKLGELEVVYNDDPIVITAQSDTKDYDRTPLVNGNAKVEGLPADQGFTVEVETAGSQTEVGSSDNVIESYVIKYNGEDKTSFFTNVETASGTLTVEKRPLVITAQSHEFAYDGEAHTWPYADYPGLLEGDEIDVTVEGSILQPTVDGKAQTVANKVTGWTFVSGDPDNYDVSTVDGELTMKNATIAIVVAAADAEWVYDGQPHSARSANVVTPDDQTPPDLREGDYIVAEVEGTVTNVADTAQGNNKLVSVRVMHRDEDASYDVTDNYAITMQDGTLTVLPRPITVAARSDETYYDGTAHAFPEIETPVYTGPVDEGAEVPAGLVEGHKIATVITSAITYPWQSPVPNVIESYSISDAAYNDVTANYAVTVLPGELTVIASPLEIVVESESAEFDYDGTAHSASGYTQTGELFEGDVLVVDVTGQVTDVADTYAGNNALSCRVVHDDLDVTQCYQITAVPGTLTVNPAQVTVTPVASGKDYGQADPKLEATVQGLLDDADGLEFAVARAKGENVGTYAITASGAVQQGNYQVIYGDSADFTIAPVQVTITAQDASKTYGEPDPDFKATVEGLVAGDATAVISFNAKVREPGEDVGAYAITPDAKAVQGNYRVTVVPATLTIEKRSVVLTSRDTTKEYDGEALVGSSVAVSGDGWARNEGASIEFTGSQLAVGSTQNAFAYTLNAGTDAANYDIATVFGTLAVTDRAERYPLTLAANSATATYNGTAQSVSGVTAKVGEDEFVGAGDAAALEFQASNGQAYTLTGVSARVTGTDAGTYAAALSGTPRIADAQGNDVTGQFAITTTDGTLVIARAPYSISTESASKVYDGTELTAPGAVTGLVNGETVAFEVTGALTAVGDVENTYELAWTGTANEDNYVLESEHVGHLVVRDYDNMIDIYVYGGEYPYDGTEHKATLEMVPAQLPEGYILESLQPTGSVTHVSDGEVQAGAEYVIKNLAGEDVTKSLDVTVHHAFISVTPAEVRVSTGSATRAYDGTPLVNADVQVEGLAAAGAGNVTVKATGSQTDVGSSLNTYEVVYDDGIDTQDYAFYSEDDNLGTLTVTENANVAIVLTAASASRPYNGTPLTDATVRATGLPASLSVNASASGSQTEVGQAANVVDEGFQILDAAGNDVTANFSNISVQPGTLTVTRKDVTVTAADAQKTYGEADPALTAMVTGLVPGESEDLIGYEVAREAGEDVRSGGYAVTASGAAEQGNYAVTFAPGTFTILPKNVVVTAPAVEKTYGDADSAEGLQPVIVGALDAQAVRYSLLFDAHDEDAGLYPKAVHVFGASDQGNYTVLFLDGDLTIVPKPIVVAANPASKVYGEPDPDELGATVSGLVGDDAVDYTVTRAAGEDVREGGYAISASGAAEQGNYLVSYEESTFTIQPRPITIASGSAEKEYDGTALTNDEVAVASGSWVDGDGATYQVTGGQTAVGRSANTFEYVLDRNTKAENYDITLDFGTLTVLNRSARYEIWVAANSAEYTYNGSEQTVRGLGGVTYQGVQQAANGSLTPSFTVDGNVYTIEGVSAELARTNASATAYTVPVVASAYAVRDASGNVVTDQFSVHFTNGTLKINPAPATVVTGSASGQYDGSALTNPEASIVGLLGDDSAVVTATGSQTEIGSSPNTYEIAWENGLASNYVLSASRGTLSVTANTAPVTLTAASGSKVYDGTPLVNPEVVADGLPAGFTAQASASGSATNVSDRGVNTVDTAYVIRDAAGVDRTSNFASITRVAGTLSIKPRPATVIAPNVVKVYGDADPALSTLRAQLDGVIGYYEPAYTVALGLANADAGVYEGAIQVSGEALQGNYELSYQAGTLTVQQRPATFTSPSATKAYDGSPLTALRITADNLAAGEVPVYSVDGAQTYVGASDNGFGIADSDTFKVANYAVTKVFGTLTVTGDVSASDVMGVSHAPGVYALGQQVTFDVYVTNVYDSAQPVSLSAPAGVTLQQASFRDVAPGATVRTTATYTVTEDAIAAGGFANLVTAVIGQNAFTATDAVSTDAPAGSLGISASLLYPQSEYAVGDIVSYSIVVANEGNVSLSDVRVSDLLQNAAGSLVVQNAAGGSVDGTVVTFDALAPGESRKIAVTYTTLDADAGKRIGNTAQATGTGLSGAGTVSAQAEPAQVQGLYTLTVHYVYDDGAQAAPDYSERLAAGASFRVESPAIDGYTPDYRALVNDENGMYARDIELTVTYTADAVALAPQAGTAAVPAPAAPDGTPADDGAAPAPDDAAAPATEAAADGAVGAQEQDGAAAEPPVAEVTIDDDDNPLAETIADDETALVSNIYISVWSLLDVLATAGAVLMSALMLAGLAAKRREDDGDAPQGNRTLLRALSLVPAAGTAALLISTQNFDGTMVLFDQWTVVFALALLAQGALQLATTRRAGDIDDGATPAPATA